MRILIPLLGKTREHYLEAGIRDYAGRLARYYPVEMPVLKEKEAKGAPELVAKRIGSDILLERARGADFLVALDPGGKATDSPGLATLLSAWQDRGVGTICFLLGGHVGLSTEALAAADYILSLSAMTFTHELSRLLLLEQLYRASSINAGHNYHR